MLDYLFRIQETICIDWKEFYHSVEGGLSGSSYEHGYSFWFPWGGWPTEWIHTAIPSGWGVWVLLHLATEAKSDVFDNRDQTPHYYQCSSEKHTISAKDLLILDLYTFRFGRGISHSVQNQPDNRHRFEHFYGAQRRHRAWKCVSTTDDARSDWSSDCW